MTPKDKYRKLCKTESSIPIFSKDWWLDAVCGGNNWDVVVIEKGGDIVAVLPFYMKEELGFKQIIMPPLTQTMGPWIKYPERQKYVRKLSYEKEIMNLLIKQIPYFHSFEQNFHYSVTNWLPFYWKGFKQTTRYTYRIEDLKDLDIIWNGFRENIRTDIRKAKRKVCVFSNSSIEQFFQINILTFTRQGLAIPYSIEFIKHIDEVSLKNNVRKIFFAKDAKNRIHAALYLIWDDASAYYLLGGDDPELRNSGANSLIMWEAIQFASTVTLSFDFEGSMIEPVERFFRAFGAKQVPYFKILNDNMPLYGKALINAKSNLNRIKNKLYRYVRASKIY